MNDCSYCQVQNNILAETDNFVVKVKQDFYLEGSIEILTKNHLNCMAELEEDIYYIELDKILEEIRVFYKKMYNKDLVWYEHGIAGQEIRHASIVCLPTNKPILRMVINRLKNPKEIEYFEEWQEFYGKYGRYYLFDQYDSLFIFNVERALKDQLGRIVRRKLKIDKDKGINNRTELIEKIEKDWNKWKVTI